jgi:hypothetical protein
MRWFFSAERALFFCFYATRTGRQTTVRQKAWEIPLALASGELSRMAGMQVLAGQYTSFYFMMQTSFILPF